MLSFYKLGRLCLNYIFNRWRHVVTLASTKEVTGAIKGDISSERGPLANLTRLISGFAERNPSRKKFYLPFI